MNTSLGYHTMELSLMITPDEASQLIQSFRESKDVYFTDPNGKFIYGNHCSSRYYTIRYRQRYKGLSWSLRYNRKSPDYMRQPLPDGLHENKCCTVKAKINPKILLGMDDYIAAADSSYLQALISVFNQEVKRISPILQDFGAYSLGRIDYCINFDLADLMINCYPEEYMVLIQQADIPNHFSEYKEYRGTTHRKKPGINSFYLENNSVRINCYCKYYQLLQQFSSVPHIEDSLHVIRFEVQCLYLKTWQMQKKIRNCENFEKIMSQMLSDILCEKIITEYYCKTIGKGDYYSLEGARKKIKSMKFKRNKEERLLNALKQVSLHRGIFKAKFHLQDKELDDLKRSIKELEEIGINPVTIPRGRGIQFLPNLLNAYLKERERTEKAFEEYYGNRCV